MNEDASTEGPGGIGGLLDVVDRLRGEGGCPWDREQTIESLKQYLVEESYEVLDAIDDGDPDRHKDELGDVLLQVLLHSRIRAEEGVFTFDDVVNVLTEKLVRRHPHVFGDVEVDGSEGVLRNWEAIKAGERGGDGGSAVDGVPRHLPALQKAQRIQSRVSRVGFDWPDGDGPAKKVDEELAEVREAIESGEPARIRDEIGDLLFAIVNLCRFHEVHAEEALRTTVDRFSARFREVERRMRSKNRDMTGCSLEELDECWEAVKRDEASGAL